VVGNRAYMVVYDDPGTLAELAVEAHQKPRIKGTTKYEHYEFLRPRHKGSRPRVATPSVQPVWAQAQLKPQWLDRNMASNDPESERDGDQPSSVLRP